MTSLPSRAAGRPRGWWHDNAARRAGRGATVQAVSGAVGRQRLVSTTEGRAAGWSPALPSSQPCCRGIGSAAAGAVREWGRVSGERGWAPRRGAVTARPGRGPARGRSRQGPLDGERAGPDQGGAEHVGTDEQDRQVGEVLDEADQALGQLDHQEHGRRPYGGRGCFDRPSARTPGRSSARSAKRPRRRGPGRPWPGRGPLRFASSSPAWGPLPVTITPIVMTAGAGCRQDPHQLSDGPGHQVFRWGVAFGGALPQRVRESDQHHRQQEVHADDPRVEVGQHRDAADHALHRDAQQHRHGQPDAAPAAGDARAGQL